MRLASMSLRDSRRQFAHRGRMHSARGSRLSDLNTAWRRRPFSDGRNYCGAQLGLKCLVLDYDRTAPYIDAGGSNTMRRPLTLTGLLLVGAVAWACGDKLMLVMGSRLSQIRPLHP